MSDPSRVRELATAAGFAETEVGEVSMEWRFDSFEDYWAYLLEVAGAIAVVIAGLSDEDREAVKAETAQALGGRLELEGMCVNALAR